MKNIFVSAITLFFFSSLSPFNQVRAKSPKQPLQEFHAFVQKGDIQSARLAMENGVDVNGVDSIGHTALDYAHMSSDLEMIKFLILESKIILNWDLALYQVLSPGVGKNDIEFVKLIIETSKDHISKINSSVQILELAIREGRVEIFKLLLEDPRIRINLSDDFDREILVSAAFLKKESSKEFLDLILNHPKLGIDENSEIKSNLLFLAATHSNFEVFDFFVGDPRLNHGTNSRTRKSLLHTIARQGSDKFLRSFFNREPIERIDEHSQKIFDYALELLRTSVFLIFFDSLSPHEEKMAVARAQRSQVLIEIDRLISSLEIRNSRRNISKKSLLLDLENLKFEIDQLLQGQEEDMEGLKGWE